MSPPDRALILKAESPVSAPLAPKTLDWDEGYWRLRGLVPKSFAVRHLLVPLALEGDVLTVAMARPDDATALRRLRMITRCQIQPLLAPGPKVYIAIARLYG